MRTNRAKAVRRIEEKIRQFQKVSFLNVVFEQKFNTALFKDDEVAMNDIQKPCMNEEDFNNRIQALSILIGFTFDRNINSRNQESIEGLTKYLEEYHESN